jgi:putative GTP pyrophosphokinase
MVIQTIRKKLKLETTGRPAKSTSSIIEKLLRESIRLTQVQDIAGCRVVVADVLEQERVVASLRDVFLRVTVIDRRKKPSYGYRAIHVVARIAGKLIEIQVRSSLQHLWAEFSEKLSDVVDPAIKYGGGNDEILQTLTNNSATMGKLEDLEKQLALEPEQHLEVIEQQQELRRLKTEMSEMLTWAISWLENQKEREK